VQRFVHCGNSRAACIASGGVFPIAESFAVAKSRSPSGSRRYPHRAKRGGDPRFRRILFSDRLRLARLRRRYSGESGRPKRAIREQAVFYIYVSAEN